MMKKLLLIPVLIIFAFSGCITEYVYLSTYVYKNQTSYSITVKAHSCFLEKDSVFIIPPSESHMLEFMVDGSHYSPPFWGDYISISDYIVVSNGEKQFIHKFYPPDPETNNLYQEETYKLVKERKRHRTYEYIFTDDDFVNAEPIEPSDGSVSE